MRGVYAYAANSFGVGGKEVVGVEVGVHLGLNAFDCLMQFPNLKLHLVDNYRVPFSQRAKDAAVYVLAPFHDRITFHYKSSVEAAKGVADGSVDFVYIDANHIFEAVMIDIEAWKPKVKQGGVIGGHDFYMTTNRRNNGVRDAVYHSFPPKTEIKVATAGADWWVKL